MEFLKQYEKEYMKKAMLKHEEMFREQVSELHRLYKVQKLLMRDMRDVELIRQVKSAYSQSESNIGSRQSHYSYREQSRARKSFNLELPADEYIDEHDEDIMPDNESNVDLTLSIGRSRRRKEDASFTSDSATSFSSTSTTDSGGENLKLNSWGLTMKSMSYASQKNVFVMEDTMRHSSLKQPSWNIQCLSLNMA